MNARRVVLAGAAWSNGMVRLNEGPGPLMRSVLANVPLLVDEIALIDPRVLTVLYPLMGGRGELHVPMNPV